MCTAVSCTVRTVNGVFSLHTANSTNTVFSGTCKRAPEHWAFLRMLPVACMHILANIVELLMAACVEKPYH